MEKRSYAVGLLLIATCGILSSGTSLRVGVEDNAADEAPLSIAASTVGRFAKGHSWHLSMNSAGQAELTIKTHPKPIRRRFQVTPEQMRAFRKEVARERFFDLGNEYGQHVPDGSTDTITVIIGDRVKTVKTHFLMNWVHGDVAKLVEPCRVVRIQGMIRGWFQDVEAVDLREYDQMVIKAVKASVQQSSLVEAGKRAE